MNGDSRSENGLNDPYADAQIVTEVDFPHGLRCADCDREMKVGERYSARLEAFSGDIPITVVTCEPCGLAVADEAAGGSDG